jgi:tetratricopeptide (TPR) repeat protein
MRNVVATLATVAVLFASSAAHADALEQAKTLFNAGAQAYAAGQFPAAIQAFEESYRLAPKPAILFSAAQAYRRQYYVDKQRSHLSSAIAGYRKYLELVPQGGRRADAVEALAELEPLAAKLGADTSAPAPEGQGSAAKAPTRLMVSSPTKDAEVLLDGKPVGEMPLIEEVAPGRHGITVRAPGHFDEERELLAVEGNLVALDVTLRERPARLDVASEAGADVYVDGRPMGTLPLSAPLELAPGTHLVAVTLSGHTTYSSELTLARGETRKVAAPLGRTGQRVASYVLLGVGTAGAIAGGVFAGLAYRQQSAAEEVLDAQSRGNISRAQLDDYDAATLARDDLRRGSAIALAGALAVGGTGILLYAFDSPVIDVRPARSDQPKAAPSDKPREDPLDLAATPVLTGDLLGAAVLGRF